MRKGIAYCGLDCEACDAYIATRTGDQALKEKTARLWSELNQTEIRPEDISCQGCRMEGVKSVYCAGLCPIRKCAQGRGAETCGSCPEMEGCGILGPILKSSPDARQNLTEGKNR